MFRLGSEKIRLAAVAMTVIVLLAGCGQNNDKAEKTDEASSQVITVDTTENGQGHYEMPEAGEAAAKGTASATEPEAADTSATEAATETAAEATSEATTDATTEAATEASAGAATTEAATEATSKAAVPAAGGGRIVCIDAGHQSHQNSEREPIGPGASESKIKVAGGTSGAATGVPEYQLTLAVALKLQSVLTSRGYTVVMCRTSNDVNISNAERAQIANNAGAGAFIRIHANGSTNAGVSGALSMAPSSKNPYCSAIASSSQTLARDVINGFCAKTGATNKGVSITDSMSGINWCTVPVTIIEMGFMTNPAEDKQMEDDGYQTLMAEGIADGIDAYFAQ